jgi:hypothetical protein
LICNMHSSIDTYTLRCSYSTSLHAVGVVAWLGSPATIVWQSATMTQGHGWHRLLPWH